MVNKTENSPYYPGAYRQVDCLKLQRFPPLLLPFKGLAVAGDSQEYIESVYARIRPLTLETKAPSPIMTEVIGTKVADAL